MNQNYQRSRVDREQDDPGSKSQAAALSAAELSQETQGRSQSQDAARSGRGWDDLSAETLNTDQTTRR
jgi:hypothetical protein